MVLTTFQEPQGEQQESLPCRAGLAPSPGEKGKQRNQKAFGNGRACLGTKGYSRAQHGEGVYRTAGSIRTLV